MQNQFVNVEVVETGIAVVTVDRHEALNALNAEVLESLNLVFEALSGDSELRAVILTGAGKAFVAGADIPGMSEMSVAEAREFAMLGQRVMSRIEGFRCPVIAAVNGFALGGGCELAMACDIRIAGERAKFGQPEVSLGITPGFGGTQRLPRLVGRGHAKHLIFTGEIIGAERALQIGLVQEVVAPDMLMSRCLDIARIIKTRAPVAVALSKQSINDGVETDLHRSLQAEANVFAQTFATADQSEGMKAFIEKRPPEFKNR